jgi:hypothetical protein
MILPLRPFPVALLSFALVLACSDSPGPSDPEPVGRDSASTAVFARIGGIPWGAQQEPTNLIMSATYPFGGRILGSLTGGDFRNYLYLDVGQTHLGTYALNDGSGTTGYFDIVPKSGNLDSTYTFQAFRGSVSITGYDPTTCELRGTFWFDAARTGAGPNGYIEIRNGVLRGIAIDTLAEFPHC